MYDPCDGEISNSRFARSAAALNCEYWRWSPANSSINRFFITHLQCTVIPATRTGISRSVFMNRTLPAGITTHRSRTTLM